MNYCHKQRIKILPTEFKFLTGAQGGIRPRLKQLPSQLLGLGTGSRPNTTVFGLRALRRSNPASHDAKTDT